jgi:hypothetical protein
MVVNTNVIYVFSMSKDAKYVFNIDVRVVYITFKTSKPFWFFWFVPVLYTKLTNVNYIAYKWRIQIIPSRLLKYD